AGVVPGFIGVGDDPRLPGADDRLLLLPEVLLELLLLDIGGGLRRFVLAARFWHLSLAGSYRLLALLIFLICLCRKPGRCFRFLFVLVGLFDLQFEQSALVLE